MKKILITNADRVVGANLAVVLAGDYRVVAVGSTEVTIGGCGDATVELTDALAVRRLIAAESPQVIIHCSPSAAGCWGEAVQSPAEERCVQNLVSAAEAVDARLVLVTGDQIFRGPWLFHTEDSDCIAETESARQALTCEEMVLGLGEGLVLRTRVVGWSPTGNGELEAMLADLENGRPFGFGHHATPTGATRFAEIVAECLSHELTGVFNVGGAERCSAFGFASALARHFDLPRPTSTDADIASETSLRSNRICKTLELTLPTVNETAADLQFEYDDRRVAFSALPAARAA